LYVIDLQGVFMSDEVLVGNGIGEGVDGDGMERGVGWEEVVVQKINEVGVGDTWRPCQKNPINCYCR